ncbi:MAG: glycosyltransferase family 2 protein [Deltaproteobacteria bacterium]|nr:glycosyltransferase family 2 protein [Deltaproteobacteria bacterium]
MSEALKKQIFPEPIPQKKSKVCVVMPAYNAASTLVRTYRAIPPGSVDEMLLVDDASYDDTVEIAKLLGIRTIVHEKNKGYGGNQKTCYTDALRQGMDIIVMLHPDYQYDPAIVPELVRPIAEGKAKVVFASRMLGDPLKGGMPLYKFIFNKSLTAIQNFVFGTHYSEFHTGYRAFHRKALEAINFQANSDDFIFDNEIIAQLMMKGFKIHEIPVITRYAKDSSSVSFKRSVVYGLNILMVTLKYFLHKRGWLHFSLFE